MHKSKYNWYKIIELSLIFISLLIGILNWIKTQEIEKEEKENNAFIRSYNRFLNRPNIEISNVSLHSCNFLNVNANYGEIDMLFKPTFYVEVKNNSEIKISILGQANMDTITDKFILREKFLKDIPKEIDSGESELPRKWINPGSTDTIPISLTLYNTSTDEQGNINAYIHYMMFYGTEFLSIYDIYFIQKITITKEMFDDFSLFLKKKSKPFKTDDRYNYYVNSDAKGKIEIGNRIFDHKIYNEEEIEIINTRINSFSEFVNSE